MPCLYNPLENFNLKLGVAMRADRFFFFFFFMIKLSMFKSWETLRSSQNLVKTLGN